MEGSRSRRVPGLSPTAAGAAGRLPPRRPRGVGAAAVQGLAALGSRRRPRLVRVICLLIGLAVCLSAQAPPLPGEAPRWQVWAAGEGTRAILIEEHSQPVIHLQVLFPAGRATPFVRQSRAEDLMDLLLRDGSGALRREIDRLGARVVAGSGAEWSSLSAWLLTEDLDRGLDLVARILGRSSFDRGEGKRLRRESSLAWRAAMRRPQFRLRREVMLTLFAPGDPRRLAWERPRRGAARGETLARVLARIVRSPGRVIGLAGDIDRGRAARVAAELLPPVTQEAPAEPVWGPARSVGERPAELEVTLPRLEQVHLALGRESVTRDDPRYPALLLADHALGGHFHSRLYRALRHESGQTYGVRTTGLGGRRSTAYTLVTFTRVANAAHAERSLREVLERLHREGIDDGERRLALSALRGRLNRRAADPSSLLRRLGRDLLEGREPGAAERELDSAAALSLEEINAVVREFYDPRAFTVWRVGPAR